MTQFKSWLNDFNLLFIDDYDNPNFYCFLLLLFSALLFFFNKNKLAYLFLSLFVFFTYIFYIKQKEKETKTMNCRMPTNDNPMANVMPLADDAHLEACDNIPEEEYQKYLYSCLYEKTYDFKIRDRLDILHTKPVTSFPDDKEKFLKYVYGQEQNCKADGVNCESYRDMRFRTI